MNDMRNNNNAPNRLKFSQIYGAQTMVNRPEYNLPGNCSEPFQIFDSGGVQLKRGEH